MSKEDNTKKPQFVIPESAESKPVNKLLVPNESENNDAKLSKPKLVTTDSDSSAGDEKVKKILIPNQEPTPEPTLELTPEPTSQNEELSAGLPDASQDNWMKDAYNQVEIAEKANEEIQTVHQQAAYSDPSPEEINQQIVDQGVQESAVPPQVNYTEQVPTQIPQIQVPQVQEMPQAPPPVYNNQYEQSYVQQPYLQQPYSPMQYQGYSQQPNYGEFQNQMTNGQTPMMQVPNRSGLPVGLWFFMGLVLGLIIAIAGLKLAPQSIAESIRPDLVEKGKNLVIIDGVRQGESSEKSE